MLEIILNSIVTKLNKYTYYSFSTPNPFDMDFIDVDFLISSYSISILQNSLLGGFYDRTTDYIEHIGHLNYVSHSIESINITDSTIEGVFKILKTPQGKLLKVFALDADLFKKIIYEVSYSQKSTNVANQFAITSINAIMS